MLAIGRSVFRPRLHSSLPVAAFSTAADHAATPDGPVAETEETEARAAGAAAPRAADAASAVPASRPHTRMLRRALIPCRSLLDSRRATGAKPVTYGNPRQNVPQEGTTNRLATRRPGRAHAGSPPNRPGGAV